MVTFFGLFALVNALLCGVYLWGRTHGNDECWKLVTEWREFYEAKSVELQAEIDKVRQSQRDSHNCSHDKTKH